MMKNILFPALLCGLFFANFSCAQKMTKSPMHFAEITDYPTKYSTGGTIARMIDGLGYRYYWASEGLRKEDLKYKISEDSRAAGETLEHIHSLSYAVLRTMKGKTSDTLSVSKDISFEQLRAQTLDHLWAARSIAVNKSDKEFEDLQVIFARSKKPTDFPFWNLINGPITDAIYHTGQIVSYRRASGNPLNPKVNVLRGKNRE